MKKDSVGIKNLEARPGEKAFAFIDVNDTFGTISQLPVGIVSGTQEGPTLLVTAGVHACEYTGIEAVTRLYKETQPKGLKGNLIAITCMNIPALRMRMPFVVPFDNKNLNRVFPGSPTGSASEVIAHTVMKEFLPKADYVVDCHAGDIGEKLFPMTICNQTNDENISEQSKQLANASGLDYSYFSDVRSGGDGNWVTEANKAGVPSIVAEVGYDGRYPESDIIIHVKVVNNIMRHLGMIPGAVERESARAQTAYFSSLIPVKTTSTGIFDALVDIKETIARDQIVAEIKDLKGDVVEQIRSPEDGVLLMVIPKRIVNSGDSIFYLCKPEE